MGTRKAPAVAVNCGASAVGSWPIWFVPSHSTYFQWIRLGIWPSHLLRWHTFTLKLVHVFTPPDVGE